MSETVGSYTVPVDTIITTAGEMQAVESRLDVIEDLLNGMAQVSPEMMGGVMGSLSSIGAKADRAQNAIEGLVMRLRKLEAQRTRIVTCEAIDNDHALRIEKLEALHQDETLGMNEWANESARDVAQLFLTLIDLGASPSQATNVTIAWMQRQGMQA